MWPPDLYITPSCYNAKWLNTSGLHKEFLLWAGEMSQRLRVNKNKDVTGTRYGQREELYCRYEAEFNQRHLQGSRLNQAMAGAGRVGFWGEKNKKAYGLDGRFI